MINYRVERSAEERCPQCGSSNLAYWFCGEECGCMHFDHCNDCGYIPDVWNPQHAPNAPYIHPGDPGSHDTIEEYR